MVSMPDLSLVMNDEGGLLLLSARTLGRATTYRNGCAVFRAGAATYRLMKYPH